jgi:hypothetical protein
MELDMNLNGMRLRSGLSRPALELDYPELTDPVRDVHTRKLFRVRRRHYSVKNQRYMDCEYRNEESFCILSDVDPSILAYRAQPKTVDLRIDGTDRRYTPDFFYVTRGGERWYIEVKGDEHANDDDILAKHFAFAEWCTQRGYRYRMVLKSEMEAGARLKNAALLLRDKNVELSADALIQTVSYVGFEGKSPVDVADYFGLTVGAAYQRLRCLTLFEHLTVDLDTPLTCHSVFARPV